jgi:hypothetical protein
LLKKYSTTVLPLRTDWCELKVEYRVFGVDGAEAEEWVLRSILAEEVPPCWSSVVPLPVAAMA